MAHFVEDVGDYATNRVLWQESGGGKKILGWLTGKRPSVKINRCLAPFV